MSGREGVGLSLRRRVWAAESDVAARTASLALVPAELLYRGLVAARNRLYDAGVLRTSRSDIQVVSVGNLTVGGTGKTPFSAWLAERFDAAGRRPAIVHGGYARDEPELHRQWHPDIPVIVDKDRTSAVRQAARSGCRVAILDDGFQHRRLDRDSDIVLVAAETGLRDVRLLPRGPYREPAVALRRADAVVITRKVASTAEAEDVAEQAGRITASERIAIVSIEPAGWRSGDGAAAGPEGRVLAVAALAEPEAFSENAIAAGARVSGTMWFRDHHEYTVDDARRILESSHGGPVVTTAKDAVKLSLLLPPSRLWVLDQRIVVEAGADVLENIIGREAA